MDTFLLVEYFLNGALILLWCILVVLKFKEYLTARKYTKLIKEFYEAVKGEE